MLIYEPSVIHGSVPQAPGISPRLAGLLYARGARTPEEMEAFLHPSALQFHNPLLFADMAAACERIRAAIGREKICVYGDYDADGVCATAILADCLAHAGANVVYDIPSRHDEGYGLSIQAVEKLHAQGVKLIITVDNGVKAYAEIARCYELGMEVIVTDHHRCDGRIPECCAVVCHTRSDNTYPNADICGAGIAFKLVEALCGSEVAMRYLPLAGVATMADVVPLTGENRAIVALALQMINRGECCEGLRALGRAVNDKAKAFTARDIAFGFAPRLNAAGRMDDARVCVKLLCSGSAKEADDIAQMLDVLNRKRQAEESTIIESAAKMTEADDLTQKRCIVLKSESWNPGVIGIAAARIAERYYRPTLLLSQKDGVLTGSARSVPGVDLYAALNANARFFTRFGGHAYAAGVTMPAECFDEFAAELDATFRAAVNDELFLPRRTYEAEIELSELTMDFAAELEQLAPFGEGNPEPAFRTDGIMLRGVKCIGSEATHIKATAVKNDRYIDLVAFSQGYRFAELADMERCDAIYVPNINEWKGMRSVQLRAYELRSSDIVDAEGFISARRDKFIDAFSRNVLYNSGYEAKCEIEDDARLEELLRDGIAGTLMLCITPEGAADLINQLGGKGLLRRADMLFCANRPSPCAYHTLLLAPELDKLELSRYRNIVLFDSRDEGLLNKLKQLAPLARVSAARAYPLNAFCSLCMEREDIAVFYRALAAKERRLYNRGELCDYLAAVTGRPPRMARLAADVMCELGFISEEGGISLVRGAAMRSLEESPTYAALLRLKK